MGLSGMGSGFNSWAGLVLSFISLGADTAQLAISQRGKARMQVCQFICLLACFGYTHLFLLLSLVITFKLQIQ